LTDRNNLQVINIEKFHKNLFNTKSNDLASDSFRTEASKPYNKIGMHLLDIN